MRATTPVLEPLPDPAAPARIDNIFFTTSTESLARRLLGTYLVHDSPQGITIGRIVETEAYLSYSDPACHAARGKTERNAPMFGPPGHGYVYLIYGMYHCFNVVSAREGVGEAVLVRALEPIDGIELMQERRKSKTLRDLCAGPGRLTQAMGITLVHNNADLSSSELHILPRHALSRSAAEIEIVASQRIGISCAQNLLLRFCDAASPFLSKRP
jgi:DNA-3-methyladenine glycosylase